MMRFFISLPLLAVAAFVLFAQSDSDALFRADSRLVVLHATVVDNKGDLVTNLGEGAFRAYEDDVEQRIKVFRHEDIPVSMGIIVDNSASMKEKRKRVETAALALVKASNPEDEVFIVNFNDEVFRDVDFTSDPGKLAAGLARIDCRGGTAMRDAIYQSINYMKAKARHDKKVLVVITDGNDNMSEVSLEKMIGAAEQRGVLIYSIGLLHEESARDIREAHQALDASTKATGGEAYYPKGADEVESIALKIARDIRSQYTIAYTPSNQTLDGSYRRIRVTVHGARHTVVRTRTGYYATADLSRPSAISWP